MKRVQEMNFIAQTNSLDYFINVYGYNVVFFNIRNLWSASFLDNDQALKLAKQLKDLSNYYDDPEQFPNEADQFIFMLEGSEK